MNLLRLAVKGGAFTKKEVPDGGLEPSGYWGKERGGRCAPIPTRGSRSDEQGERTGGGGGDVEKKFLYCTRKRKSGNFFF